MTAARFTTSHRPMEQRGPIQPMTDEQRRFWQLRRERAGMQQPKRGLFARLKEWW